jgi:hypothetical protein
MAEHTVALTVAVAGALDMTLNQGKGRILENWTKEVLGHEGTQEKRPKMTERAFSFFTSMPRRKS